MTKFSAPGFGWGSGRSGKECGRGGRGVGGVSQESEQKFELFVYATFKIYVKKKIPSEISQIL